jgi:hypothetical protein
MRSPLNENCKLNLYGRQYLSSAMFCVMAIATTGIHVFELVCASVAPIRVVMNLQRSRLTTERALPTSFFEASFASDLVDSIHKRLKGNAICAAVEFQVCSWVAFIGKHDREVSDGETHHWIAA